MAEWRALASGTGASIRRSFADHLPLYACSFSFYGFTLLLFARYDFSLPLTSALFFLKFVANFAVLWLGVLAARDLARLWRQGAPRPLAQLGRRMAERFLTGERAGNSFHAIVVLTPMMMVFAGMKENIPRLNAFSWDATFEAWDRALAFGHMPWELLQSVLGFAPVTVLIGFVYNLWFVVMFSVLLWQAFSARRDALRQQYLLAFGFAWFFGGSLLAIAFSSAGPCFYHHLVPGPSPYAAQLAYLKTIGENWLWSLAVQDALWTSYTTGIGEIRGISAMPSMHVTIAMLLALLGWRTNRVLGWSLGTFAAFIVIGSVHLAWHYAVDAVAGIAIALLCWAAAGWITRAWFARVKTAPAEVPAE